MKRITIITLTLAFLLFLPANTFADANKADWFGTWAIFPAQWDPKLGIHVT